MGIHHKVGGVMKKGNLVIYGYSPQSGRSYEEREPCYLWVFSTKWEEL